MPTSAYTYTTEQFFGKAGPQEFFNPSNGPTERTGADPTVEEFLHQQYDEKFRVNDGSNWSDIALGFGDWVAGEIDRALWGPNTSVRIEQQLYETGTGQKAPLWMEVSAVLEENRDAIWSFVGSLLLGSALGGSASDASQVAETLETSGTSITAEDLWEDASRGDGPEVFDSESFYEDSPDPEMSDLPVEESLVDDVMSDETQEDVIDEESAGSFEDVAAVYDELPEEPGGLDDTNDWQPDFTDDFDTEVDAFFELIHNLNPDEDPNWDRNSLVEDDYLGLGSLDLLLDQPGLVDPFFEEIEEFEGFERSTLDELSYSF